MEIDKKRCPDCGSPASMSHLRNCKTHGAHCFKTNSNETATRAQIDFVSDLIKQLGYSEDDYKLGEINQAECSKLIDSLMTERG